MLASGPPLPPQGRRQSGPPRHRCRVPVSRFHATDPHAANTPATDSTPNTTETETVASTTETPSTPEPTSSTAMVEREAFDTDKSDGKSKPDQPEVESTKIAPQPTEKADTLWRLSVKLTGYSTESKFKLQSAAVSGRD